MQPTTHTISAKIDGYKIDTGLFKPDNENSYLIIYCSGFPGNIKTSKKIAFSFAQLGYKTVYFDYRGIGNSEGKLDFVSQIDDLKALVTQVKENEPIDRVIVVGHGYGGRVAICTTADDNRIDGCAVWESIGDVRAELDTFTGKLGWRLYNRLWVRDVRGNEDLINKLKKAADVLNPLELVKKISPRPILIIHRKGDPMVSINHAYSLEKNAFEPKMLVLAEGWMHSDEDDFFTSNDTGGAVSITDSWIKKYLPSQQN